MQERKIYTLEEKRQHVASWRASGLTRQQHCELLGIIPGMGTGYQSGTQA